jgi:DHA1 family 2-module integral membrane pump EmrD-like MFS transporter
MKDALVTKDYTVAEKRKISFLLFFLIAVSLLGVDLYLPSMTAIQSYFHISERLTQLTITFFLCGLGVSQFAYGTLSEKYGRRKAMLAGLAIAFASSLLCIVSNNIYLLLFARFSTGVGCGAIWVLQRTIMRDVFKNEELTKFASYIALIWAVTLSVAPSVGGHIQHYLGWRFNFAFLSIAYGLALFLSAKYLFETAEIQNNKSLAINDIAKDYFSFLKNKTFLIYVLITTLAFGGFMAYAALSPFIFMQGFKLSAIQYGWLGIYISLAYICTTAINSRLGNVFSIDKRLLLGFMLMLSGGIGLFILQLQHVTNVATIMWVIIIFISGVGFTCPNATVGAMSSIDGNFGIASSLYGAIQIIGSTIVVWISGQFFLASIFTLAIVFVALALCCALLRPEIFSFGFLKKAAVGS